MNRQSQKGSALLIVLGFLSFMVVSAVAFSIWMRSERLPSSALRRTVANRYLVKAALAHAMSRVDDAIRSHPYPGYWCTNAQDTAYHDKNGSAYDWWESRVFMPPNPDPVYEEDETKPGDDNSRYAPASKTVSVLNLEAMGYLPPAIANDVRLLSRCSWAAQWDYFNFDAGRYVFCAVNVSDLLDVNKIAANSPRTSASAVHAKDSGHPPSPSRFSLAYLFRDGDDNFSSVNTSYLDKFDDVVHKARPEWKDAPLVSLMDYSLVLGEAYIGPDKNPLWSPFYYLASGKNKSGNLYSGNGNTPYARGARRQPFITDTWFPASDSEMDLKNNTNLFDIAQCQPFESGKMNNIHNVREAVDKNAVNSKFAEKMISSGYCLSNFDPVLLYDYLDEDSMPLSLAMPCAERVPMVTVLGPETGSPLEVRFADPVSAEPSSEDGTPAENEVYKVYDINIKVTSPQIRAGLVFPFMSRSGDDSANYDVQAFMRLVFVDEGANVTADTPAITLRNDGFADLRPKKKADWKEADDKQFRFPEEESNPNGLLLTSFGTDSWKPDVVEPKDVYKEDGMKRNLGSRDAQEETILRKIDVYEVTKSETNPTGAGTEKLKETRYRIVLRPFTKDGKSLANISTEPMPENEFDAFCAEHNIRPYLMVWVRVKNGEETVDMVPAMPEDDEILNQVDNSWFSHGRVGYPFGNAEEQSRPVIHFPSKMTFTYKNAKNKEAPSEKDWVYKSCYALDPRYNWAPENWWFSQDEPTLGAWYSNVFNDGGILNELAAAEVGANADNPRGDRARDPLLFVSNLGYLQSVGELAFLPRLSLMEGTGGNNVAGTVASGGILDAADYKGTFFTRDTVRNMPCAGAAWKSYQNYRTNPNAFEFGANLYRRGLVNPQQGFYVNPFTQSREVMLAAFANTPLNYWVAGTNYNARGKSEVTEFRSQDVFDADTSFRADYLADYMMHRYEDLSRMLKYKAGTMTREQSYMMQKVWEDMFDALDWGGRLKQGKTMNEIYAELANYYDDDGGGSKSSYEVMYKEKNQYSDLNCFVTGGGAPRIEIDTSRAVHGTEPADPLSYYANNKNSDQSFRTPTSPNYICDVDRMFLHSYWRDCFANKQQLFLIFVRAESTALGGTGENTPAQQGGRAVALVWRDPGVPMGEDVKENEDGTYQPVRHPHKMRVLFYRQFD